MSGTPNSPYEIAVPVDRARAEALRARLHAELDRQGPTNPTPRTTSAEPQELQMSPSPTPPPARRTIAWVAAAVVAVGLAGVLAVVASRDDGPQPGSAPPPTSPSTSAPTTIPPTTTTAQPTTTTLPPTTTRPPLPDAEIAAMALPDPTAWGEEWMRMRDFVTHAVEMRGDIAAAVPECADFLAAFERADRPATIGTELSVELNVSALASAYVVVFPDRSAAVDMFDAIADPRFVRECSPAYDQRLFDLTGQDLSQPGFSYFPFFNDRPSEITFGESYANLPDLDLAVDDQWRIQLDYPANDERFYVTAIRVDRVVAVVQGIRMAGGGELVTDDAQYESILRELVERVRTGLGLTA